MARVDDVGNFKMEDLTASVDYPFTLQSKMCWSKNVLEERDAPEQVIFGANNPNFCAILGLAIHLEHGLKDGSVLGDDDHAGPLLFGISKHVATKQMGDVVNDELFPRTQAGLLGTHSLQKLPATYARRNGCGRDDVDVNGGGKEIRSK
eukprot:12384492-Ditylum_brightwellii.AAC.1